MEKREFHPFYGWAWSVQYFGLVIPKTPLYSMMTLISFWFRSSNLLLYVQRCVVLYVALSHCFLLSLLCVSLNDSVNRVEIVNANCVVMHSLDWIDASLWCQSFSCPFLRSGLVFFSLERDFNLFRLVFHHPFYLKQQKCVLQLNFNILTWSWQSNHRCLRL